MVLLIFISSLCHNVQFKKMPILPPQRELEIPGVMGFLKKVKSKENVYNSYTMGRFLQPLKSTLGWCTIHCQY